MSEAKTIILSDPKKIKMVREYAGRKPGDVLEHHGVVADAWVRRGIAAYVGGESKPAEAKPADKK